MIELGSAAQFAVGGTFGTLALAAVGRYIVRRIVRDSVETVKDRAEINVVESLTNYNRQLQGDLRTVNAELKVANDANNASMRELGRLSAKVEALTEEITRTRAEAIEQISRSRADDEKRAAEIKKAVDAAEERQAAYQRSTIQNQRQLAEKVSENTELTKKGITAADNAFSIANTINDKIQSIGMEMKDGKSVETSQEEADAHQTKKNGKPKPQE